MEMQPIAAAAGAARRLSDRAFYALAAALLFAGYWAALRLTGEGSALDHALGSLRNLVPLAILTAAAQPLVRRLAKRRPAVQLAGHIGLAAAFSVLWYWMLMVLIGLSAGQSFTQFVVRAFFPGPAVTWQLLQGATFYALVAALTHLRARPELPSFVVADAPPAEDGPRPALSRYFIRQGEDIHPVDVAQIVSISGADDYAEVTTLTGSHLVRMTLAQFESALEGGGFIRIHRSRIVNVERIVRAEPAGGGRLLLHMENGEMIQASRAGARLLRDRVI